MYEVKRPQIRYNDELDLGLNCAEGFKDVSFDLSLALSEMPVVPSPCLLEGREWRIKLLLFSP